MWGEQAGIARHGDCQDDGLSVAFTGANTWQAMRYWGGLCYIRTTKSMLGGESKRAVLSSDSHDETEWDGRERKWWLVVGQVREYGGKRERGIGDGVELRSVGGRMGGWREE